MRELNPSLDSSIASKPFGRATSKTKGAGIYLLLHRSSLKCCGCVLSLQFSFSVCWIFNLIFKRSKLVNPSISLPHPHLQLFGQSHHRKHLWVVVICIGPTICEHLCFFDFCFLILPSVIKSVLSKAQLFIYRQLITLSNVSFQHSKDTHCCLL